MSNRIKRARSIIRNQNWFASFIELAIVVLGVTIAYQLNVYQQKISNRNAEQSLLSKVYLENQENLAEIESLAEYAYRKPPYLQEFLNFLDSLASTGDIDHARTGSFLGSRFEEVVSTFSISINDQYLTTYMNRSFETGVGLLDPELMKLQSSVVLMRQMEMVLMEYRIDYIWTYTDRAYLRDQQKTDLTVIMDNTFRNQLMKLINLEQERARVVKEIIDQLRLIEENFQANGYHE